MGRRKKASVEGVMIEGKYLYIKKNKAYKAIEENVVYIPRSGMYNKGCGTCCAIVEKLTTNGPHWEKQTLVMNGDEFKKAVGIKDEGRITIQ